METLPQTIESPAIELHALAGEWLAHQRGRTLSTYQEGIRAFARWLGCQPEEVGQRLFCQPAFKSNFLALQYRDALVAQGLAPASVNVRLAALRSLSNFARTLGFVDWALSVKSLKVERDPAKLTGPTIEEVHKILLEAKRLGALEYALLSILSTCLLRRQEVVLLTINDINPGRQEIRVLGKGRLEKSSLSVSSQTWQALQEWLAVRHLSSDSLFGLTDNQIYKLVRRISKTAIGRYVHPHSFRHMGGTFFAQEENGSNPFAVRDILRHRTIATAMNYVDAANDSFGKLSQRLEDALGQP